MGSDHPVCHPGYWASELIILDGDSTDSLPGNIERLKDFLDINPNVVLKDLSYTLADNAQGRKAAIVASSVEDLRQKLDRILHLIAQPDRRQIRDPKGIYYFTHPLPGKVAMLFPGEGAQYAGMLSELCMNFPVARQVFDEMDSAFENHERGYLPSQIIYGTVRNGKGDPDLLWESEGAVEAMFAANAALSSVLRQFGIKIDAVAGHSTGDYSALNESGCLAETKTGISPAFVRRFNSLYQEMSHAGAITQGHLVAVGAPGDVEVRRVLDDFPGRVYVALDNCPSQIVICGIEPELETAVARLRASGCVCEVLSFRRAYHTPLFERVCGPIAELFRDVEIRKPRVEFYSCAMARSLTQDLPEIQTTLSAQWALPVRFRETIEQMYSDGYRTFIEAGPSGNLTAFVDQILRGRPYLAVATDKRQTCGIQQLLHAVAMLSSQGLVSDLKPLYGSREPKRLEFAGSRSQRSKVTPPRITLATGWPLIRIGDDAAKRLSPILQHLSEHAATPVKQDPPVAPTVLDFTTENRSVPTDEVLAGYFRNMEQFLSLQEEVMLACLRSPERAQRGELAEPTIVEGAIVPLEAQPVVAKVETPAESVEATLYAIVAERTGYPLEMLGLDQDLESELGIDSIKRVEIIGALKTRLELPAESIEGLTACKTLRAMAHRLQRNPEAMAAGISNAERSEQKPLPLLGRVISHTPLNEVEVSREFSLECDAFLRDHTLGRAVSTVDGSLRGLPVMPLTMSIEVVAEAASLLAPGMFITQIREIRAHSWITFETGSAVLRVKALRENDAASIVSVEMFEDRPGARPRKVLTGEVRFSSEPTTALHSDNFEIVNQTIGRAGRGEIYRDLMFHGPTFQGVKSIDHLAENGAEATLLVSETPELKGTLLDPVLLDQPGQVVGCWTASRLRRGYVIFPFYLRVLQLFGPPLPKGNALCRARIELRNEGEVASDLTVVRPDGTLWARLMDWRDLRFDIPDQFFQFMLSPSEIFLTEDSGEGNASTTATHLNTKELPADLFSVHGRIWEKVLAFLILTREEREEWLLAEPNPLRVDRLLLQLTAKDAVRRLLARLDVKLCPADISPVIDSEGKFQTRLSRAIGEGQQVVGTLECAGDVILANAWIASGQRGETLVRTAGNS